MTFKSTYILFILPALLHFFSCEPNDLVLQPPDNPYAGLWELHFNDDLQGAATIIIEDNGNINNGISVYIKDLQTRLTFYLNGKAENGTTSGNIIWEFRLSEDDILSLYLGKFTGIISGSSGEGNYNINIKSGNIQYYNWSGSWTMERL